MISTVFALAVLNLGIGFALAVLLEQRPAISIAWRLPSARLRPQKKAQGKEVGAIADPSQEVKQWLQAEGIEPTSAVETALWNVRWQLAKLRCQFIADEQRYRNGATDAIDSLASYGTGWRKWLRELSDQLAAEQEAEVCVSRSEVEGALLDHIVQVKTASDKIAVVLANPGAGDANTEISCLFSACDLLRDFVDDTLARLLRDQQRIDQISESLRHEPGATAYTRLGIETLFHDWWSRDEERVRLISCVLLDLDRFAQVNAQWGTETGDQILTAFEVLLQSLLRTDRGFDRVARASGDRFLLFLGDTASKNAASGAERVRQTIEATSFQIGEINIELTACCGIIELGKTEQYPDFYARLVACLVEAKKAGRNQSFIDEGTGPLLVDPQQYKVQGRVVEIEE